STADSRINAASVLFTNDLYKVFIKNSKEIFVSRFFALTLGIASIIFALIETDILGVLIFANSFYYPIVTPPFLLTIFGFRSSGRSVLIGMSAGLAVTIILKIFPVEFLTLSQKMFGVLFAMLSNAVFLLGSHYLLGQSGGWVGIKDKSYFERQKKRPNLQERISLWFKEFTFMGYCKKIAPTNEITYTILGTYFIICAITTMYSTQLELLGPNSRLMKVIYPLMLVTGTVMAMYPIWPMSVATRIKQSIINVLYPISIFYMLIFFNCFFVLVSKFAMLQILLFTVNLMIASLLIGWRLTLPAIIVGFYLSTQLYYCCYGNSNFIVKFGSPEFILIYALLISFSAIIFFVKPKQEQQEATDAKVDTLEEEVADLSEQVVHYSERVEDQGKEIERLGATAQRILNNVNHELRLPVGNVMNFAEMLNDGLGKFNEEQLKMLSDEVYKNSNRLSSMIMNMLDLATLEAKKIELNKSTINFGELVRDRVQSCRKMYLGDKKIDFEMQIEEDVLIKVDPNYMRQTVDNLVINAINFSSEGVIRISVLR
ncbi:MAG: histidine kinase dimerization/phospho-acceptor domain-containing protein, partial [Pseudomonadota bacterium]